MKKFTLYRVLFFSALLFYLVTRIIKIEDFPIYYFNDEASHPLKAEELIKNHLQDSYRQFIPLTIKSTGIHNLGLLVQLNIPGVWLFGKKIWVSRLTTALVAVLACIYLALISKDILKIKFYYATVFFVAFSPVYFLFSRTGFEVAIYTSFLAGFLYYYLMYRKQNPFYIHISVLFVVLTIYTSEKSWLVLMPLLFFLFFNDILYHWKHRKQAILACITFIILLTPLIRYFSNPINQNYFIDYLKSRDATITKTISRQEKLDILKNRIKLIYSPRYLFYYYPTYIPFFPFRNYGFFPWWSFPFIIIGIVYTLINFRFSSSRILLFTVFIAPLPGIITEPQSQRIILLLLPFACFFSLGLKVFYNLVCRFFHWMPIAKIFNIFLFLLLFIYGYHLTLDSVINGGVWFQNYGFSGIQYGAKQIFPDIETALNSYKHAYVSSFTFDSYVVSKFFLPLEKFSRVAFGDTRDFAKLNLIKDPANSIIYSAPGEYEDLIKNPFYEIKVKEIIWAPDRSPLFYKIELRYK